jgi:pyruvate ferredoxin oxidoreductase gamma subunit
MDIPNTPMMGALVKATGLLDFDDMLEETKIKLTKKFRNKPEVIDGNIQAIRRAYEELKAD